VPHDLDAIDMSLMTVVQLCDGPASVPFQYAIDPTLVPMNQSVDGSDRQREARLLRLLPGQGDFPLQEILARIPADVPISIEVPDPLTVGQIGPEPWAKKMALSGARFTRTKANISAKADSKTKAEEQRHD
jgi:hypothetical protein